MPYSPPSWDAVDLEFSFSFTPPSWGSTSLELSALSDDHDQYVVGATAGDLASVGSPYQVSWRQYVEPGSISAPSFPSPGLIRGYTRNLDFVDAYTPPSYDSVSFEFGFVGDDQEVLPSGIDAAGYGSPMVADRDRYVGVLAIGPGSAGSPVVDLWVRYVLPGGIGAGGLGTASVVNKNRFLEPAGIAAGGAGSPSVYHWTRYLFAAGVAPGSFGSPSLINKNQTVIPVALDAFKGFGVAFIDFADRTLRPGGIFGVEFGTAAVASSIRVIDQAGRSILAEYGTPLVADKIRFIYPQWIPHGNFGYPVVDRTHYVDPSGWDSSEFGLQWAHDNRQYPVAHGFDAALYGAPEITRSPRHLYPVGFPSTAETWPSTRWGTQTVWNLRQYVFQYFEVTSSDGGVFGSPIWTFVENRNRSVGTQGHLDSKFGRPWIDNTGRALLPGGVDATAWGANMVAHRIRTVYPEGLDSFFMPQWHSVHNNSRVIAPVGVSQSAYGTAAFQNTRRYYTLVGWDSSLYGVPFVAPAIRTVTVPLGPESTFGVHDVQLLTRYVSPRGYEATGHSAPYVIEHFNRAFVTSILAGKPGEPYVWNVTPEVTPYGVVMTVWGNNAIRTQYRHVSPVGVDMTEWGRNAISDRRITVRPSGFNAQRLGTGHQVRNNDPDPPYARTIYPKDYIATLYGQPTLRRNEIEPPGIESGVWGAATVRMMGCYPGGWASSSFGTAWIRGPQYVRPADIKAPDDPLSDGYIETKHDIQPRTIWATFDVTDQASRLHPGGWKLMDDQVHRERGERPVFGDHVVTLYYRGVVALSIAPLAVGSPAVELKNRRILVSGLRSLRMGIPSIPFAQDVDQATFGTSGTAVGRPTLELKNREIAPAGFDAGVVAEAMEVQNFNREVYPSGWDSFTSIGPPSGHRVHPPEPLIPVGLNATLWGTTFVSNWIRTLEPDGVDALDMTSTPGMFRDRMRVANKSVVVGPRGLRSLLVGEPSLASVPRAAPSVDIIVEQP